MTDTPTEPTPPASDGPSAHRVLAEFDVKFTPGLPRGARLGGKLAKPGVLAFFDRRAEIQGRLSTAIWGMPTVILISLAIGTVVSLLFFGVDPRAGPGPVWMLMVLGRGAMVGGVIIVFSGIWAKGLLSREDFRVADTKRGSAVFRQRACSVCLELTDGRWMALRLVKRDEAAAGRLLEWLEGAYEERLTIEG